MHPSFFDQENRLVDRNNCARHDPLPRLKSIVDWNNFKPLLKKIHQNKRKSNASRKPYNTILMFKMLVLQSPYNLSDDQAGFQARDVCLFSDFLDFLKEIQCQMPRRCDCFVSNRRATVWSISFLKPLIASFGSPVSYRRVDRSLMSTW